MANKEKIMVKKLICVVYIESENEVRYVVITDPTAIIEMLDLNRTSFNLYTDDDFPSSLSYALATTKWTTDFPHDVYANLAEPIVVTVYF